MQKLVLSLWFDDQAEQAMRALLQMSKLDIAALQAAYDGK